MEMVLKPVSQIALNIIRCRSLLFGIILNLFHIIEDSFFSLITRNENQMKSLLFFALVFLLSGCVSVSRMHDFSYRTPEAWKGYKNPRLLEGELLVKISDIHLLEGDSLKKDNLKNKIPEAQAPTLLLWSPQIRNFPYQRNVQSLSIDPPAHKKFLDKENGNTILFWDLSEALKDNDSLLIRRRFRYVAYDYRPMPPADSTFLKSRDIPLNIRKFYTKSEPFLVQSDSMLQRARQIAAKAKNALRRAEALHHWVYEKMTYVYPPEKRGAQNALQTLRGDCGQYAALFIALARSLQIPARQQSGFVFSAERVSYHVWAEIYLAGLGWYPADPTRENGFGYLDNKRLIASVGMNIFLLFAPDWATYDNSEVRQGRTPFMQLVTIVKSGFRADISTEVNVLADSLLH